MIIAIFEKERAEHFIDALNHGKPIQPPEGGGWHGADMLALAGALYAAAYSQEPDAFRYVGRELERMNAEQREACLAGFGLGLYHVIEFCQHLTGLVADGDFDARYEPYVEASLEIDQDGRLLTRPVDGFRRPPGCELENN